MAFALFAFAMSGCLDGDKPGPTPSESQTITGSISWNECKGLGASLDGAKSLMLDEGETPPGWDPDSTEAGLYFVTVNRCERVSVGDLERGPVSFLLEMHNAVNPPTACQEFNASYDDFKVLLSIWVDDPEVARFLAEAFGLPVRLGTFSLNLQSQGGAEVQQWSWANGTNGESNMTGIHPGVDDVRAPDADRIVWHNGTAVSFLDLNKDRMIPLIPFPTAQGTLAPPMRYAERVPGPFAGTMTIWKTSDYQGTFYRFGDLECKELLP